VPSAISSPMAAGSGVNVSRPAAAASGISSSPPSVKPSPVAARSSRPATRRVLISVMAANPAPDVTASPALASTAVSGYPPPGRPTSRPRLARASAVVAAARRPGRRRPASVSAASTMTGALPMVSSVARLTEVIDTAVK
jgi:hypothetical protein